MEILQPKESTNFKPTPVNSINIGGTKYPFRFELDPLMVMEVETGQDVMDGGIFRNIKVRTLVRLIVTGLTFDGSTWPGMNQTRDTQIAMVTKGVDLADLPGMLEVAMAEFVRCFPKVGEDVKKAVAEGGSVGKSPTLQ